MRVHALSGWLLISVAASASLVSTGAWAQVSEGDRRLRRQLLQYAHEAQSAGRVEEALALALRADQIDPTAGTRLIAARLRVQLGRYAEALSSAEQCLREVDHDTQTTAQNRRALRADCEAVRAQAAARVGALAVSVPAGAPDTLRVTINGGELRPPMYGIARAMDVGSVTVTATLPGAPPWSRQIAITAGREESVTVEVPHAEAATGPVAGEARPSFAPRSAAPPQSSTAAQPPDGAHANGSSSTAGATQRTLGWTASGLGLALLAGAAVSGLWFQSTASDYERQDCPQIELNDRCVAQYDELKTLQTLQLAGYLGGGALALTGIVLLATAPRTPRRASLFCSPALGIVGATCSIRF